MSGGGAATAGDVELRQVQDSRRLGRWDEVIRQARVALAHAQQSGDDAGQVHALFEMGIAYRQLGHYAEAQSALENAGAIAERIHSRPWIVSIRSALGTVLTNKREFPEAQRLLEGALAMARHDHNVHAEAAILTNLGNLYSDQSGVVDRRLKTPEGDPDLDPPLARHLEDQALASYRESAALADKEGNAAVAAGALTDAAVSAARAGRDGDARTLNDQAAAAIQKLLISDRKATLLTTVGRTYQTLSRNARSPNDLTRRADELYQQAAATAQTTGDLGAESYAVGYRGSLQEQLDHPDEALRLSRRAVFYAQKAGSRAALYRFEWQVGRLLRNAPGQLDPAIRSYSLALQSLQPERSDVALGAGNGDTRLTFRDEVGPIYFQTADLLLRRAADPNRTADQRRQDLVEARNTVERFKSGELEDYFRDPCVNQMQGQERDIDHVGPGTAVVYIIPLEDRTELLVSYPIPPGARAGVNGQGLRRYTVPVPRSQLEDEVDDFRRLLERRVFHDYFPDAAKLYDQLIRPIEPDLRADHIDTLVFVPDGKLRTIPMAALYDGKQFLVQKYAVAVTPGLRLMEPRPIVRKNIRLLANGLSVRRTIDGQTFDALPNVPGELASIGRVFGGIELLNQQFEIPKVQTALENDPYSIVHIASHGEFSSDASKTFLLTYGEKLTLNKLETLIHQDPAKGRPPVELLCLSACQTAAGDDRAALGLAGIAIKAGARSAVASLWFVNDAISARLISEFYRQLREHPDISKAKALQRAQIMVLTDPALIEYRHPIYWAPYLVIGNWL